MKKKPSPRRTTWRKGVNNVGTDNFQSKLNPEIVREIRERYARGNVTQKMLANRFSVSQPAISAILSGRYWSHVK